jgi:hypothetical protein
MFAVQTDYRTYLMHPDTELEMNEWIKVLNETLQKVHYWPAVFIGVVSGCNDFDFHPVCFSFWIPDLRSYYISVKASVCVFLFQVY